MKSCIRIAALLIASLTLNSLLSFPAAALAPAGHAPGARPGAVRTGCPDAPVISTTTTIAAGDTTYDNKNVVVHGAVVTIQGHHTFCNLTVEAGGSVNHGAADTAGLGLTILSNCLVDSTSSILVGGRGYASGAGPGSPGSTSPYCSGASHGGEGGDGSVPGSKVVYGSVTQPTELGSGGGQYSSGLGGTGGGAVHLVVGGVLHVDGAVNANGAAGLSSYGGGGSGGSVWLEVSGLEGTGVISANGGPAANVSSGGGGSGGRIAISYTTNTFAGTVQALGGLGRQRGAGGTVLTKASSARATVTVANTGGDLAAARTIFVGRPVTLDANMVVRDGGVLAPPMGDSLWLSLTGDMTVEATGTVGADGRGFASGTGPGSPGSTSPYCSGAAYGGDGGDGTVPGSHASYGSVSQPMSLGSGGGQYGSPNGGTGGGSLRITVGGALRVDGAVEADGGAGQSSYGGGGSGGSLWLEVGSLAGSGVISANGGAAANTSSGGGGSGGRIAIYSKDCFTGFDTVNRVRSSGGAGHGPAGSGTRFFGYDVVALGGVEDDFLAPTEPASPSAFLVAGLGGLTLVPFDGIPTGGAFAHTFPGMPAQIDAGSLALRVKAGSGAGVAADKIVLGFADAAGFRRVWTRYLGSTNGHGDPGLTGRPWVTGKDTTLSFDLRHMPLAGGGTLDLIGTMSFFGDLDLDVEGNTGVDYALLTYGTCGADPTGVGDTGPGGRLPKVIAINSSPNPFSRRTRVTFELPRDGEARLAVFDVSGRRVQTLYEGKAAAGIHQVDWSGSSASGGVVRSGIYFVRLEAGGTTLVRKVLLAK